MSLHLWLIRHAESTWNAAGKMQGQQAHPPLTALGRWQACQIATRLADAPLDALYTSDLRRATETAEMIGAQLELELRPDARLREHGLGEAEGLLWNLTELLERWPFLREKHAQGESLHAHIPGAEPHAAFLTRVVAAFEAIHAAHPTGHVAVVSHGGVFRSYLSHLMGAPSYPGLRFGNGAISRIELHDPPLWANILYLNDTCHVQNPPEFDQLQGSVSSSIEGA